MYAIRSYYAVLILDGIQDPRNLGALIRSAEIFDVSGIIIPERNSVRINETVVKTSTGAIEYVDIVKVKNISEAIEQLKKLDFWVYGAEASGDKYYYEENYPEKTALVLGSEGSGIRKKVKEYCDILVKIPVFVITSYSIHYTKLYDTGYVYHDSGENKFKMEFYFPIKRRDNAEEIGIIKLECVVGEKFLNYFKRFYRVNVVLLDRDKGAILSTTDKLPILAMLKNDTSVEVDKTNYYIKRIKYA